jgi:hypothetical protein
MWGPLREAPAHARYLRRASASAAPVELEVHRAQRKVGRGSGARFGCGRLRAGAWKSVLLLGELRAWGASGVGGVRSGGFGDTGRSAPDSGWGFVAKQRIRIAAVRARRRRSSVVIRVHQTLVFGYRAMHTYQKALRCPPAGICRRAIDSPHALTSRREHYKRCIARR